MIRLIVLILLCMPLYAAADPISLVATLAPVLGSTAAGFIVSYGGYIAFGALQLLGAANARRKQRAMAARQRAEYNANLQDRNVTVLTNEASWRVVYGSPAPIGGVTVAVLTSGAIDEYQHMVIVLASHECQAIDEIYLDGDPVGALDADGWASTGQFYERQPDVTVTEEVAFASGVGTLARTPVSVLSVVSGTPGRESGDYEQHSFSVAGSVVTLDAGDTVTASVTYTYASSISRVRISKHLSPGGVDTADPYLMATVPSQWTAQHKISGHTYIVLTLDLRLARFQGGPPNVSVKMRGKLLYDYRTSSTAYSANAALCAADFIASSYGYGATTGQVDTATAQAAANDCDAQGFECHGLIDTGGARDANLQQIEDAFAGASHYSGGVWRIMAGAWSTPVMTLTDDMMAAPIEVVQASEPADRRYTGARGKYAPASGLGVADDWTPYDVESYAAADGIARVRDMDLPLTATNAQCQKLAAIAVEKSRLGLTINYPAHFAAWKLQPGDRVYVTNDELGFAAKTFRLVDWTYIATAPIGLVLTEDVASAYTGTFSTADPTRATSTLSDPFERPQAPNDLQVASGTDQLLKGNDGTIVTRARVSWQASSIRTVLQGGYTQVRWRLASALDDAWLSIDLPGDASSTMLANLQDGADLVVQVRFITGVGAQGHWATGVFPVVGKSEPPSAVSGVAITQEIALWAAVSDIDLAGYQVRAVPGSSAIWSLGVPVHDGLLTSSPYRFERRLVGVQTIMIAAIDTSGNVGVAGVATLDFGAIDEFNVADRFDYAAAAFPGIIAAATVSGTDLVADVDPSVDWWAIGADDWWAYDGADDFFGGTTYLPMTYVATFAPLYGAGSVILDTAVLGSRSTVEWRVDGATVGDFWDMGGADFWDGTEFYGLSDAYLPYIGEVLSVAGRGIQWRVSIDGGPIRGEILDMAVRLQMPQLTQIFTAQAISSGGTRLDPALGSPPREWIAVEEVTWTVYADGSGAVAGRALDFDATLGPLVQTIDATGAAVSSSGQTVRVSGF